MTKSNATTFLNTKLNRSILFWLVIFVYYISISWPYEENKFFLTQLVFFDFILQFFLARIIINVFIPKFLHKNKKLFFFFGSFLLIYISFVIYSAFKYFYLAEVFEKDYSHLGTLSFMDKITNLAPFLRSLPTYMFPTITLIVFNYYKQQKETAKLLEQKKTNELNALRNQLNPHFLFNTLNNLYVLALKKSDRTPEVIAKLSEILDYILYKCDNNFVALKKETVLLHNYITLEKVRYGKRVHVSFTEEIKNEVKIAPLLLLTFLENAFKHGVSQEINIAKIDINIKGDSKGIVFYIKNTKPSFIDNNESGNRESIGLQNIKKQLDLLYLNNYTLDIENKNDSYTATLKIAPYEL